MFETLSAIALTVAASIVIAFLSPALARTLSGRLTAAGVLAAWLRLCLRSGRPAHSAPGTEQAFRASA